MIYWRTMSLWKRALDVLDAQRTLSVKDAEIQELQRLLIVQQLDYTRNARDLLAKFLPLTEDNDIRQQLIAGVMDLGDEIARLEEHVA